jgi:hypothetical protein
MFVTQYLDFFKSSKKNFANISSKYVKAVLAKAKRHACLKRAVNAVNAAQNVMPFCLFAFLP